MITLQELIILVIRILLGLFFISRGWSKLSAIKNTVKEFRKLGSATPVLAAKTSSIIELFGGAMIFLGIYPDIAAVFLIWSELSTIFLKIRLNKNFSELQSHFSLIFLILITALFGERVFSLMPGNANFISFEIFILLIFLAWLFSSKSDSGEYLPSDSE